MHDRLAVAQHGNLAGELVETVVVTRELGREHPLPLLLGVELGALESSCDCKSWALGAPRPEAERKQDTRERERGRAREEVGSVVAGAHLGSPTELADGLALSR